MDKELSRRVFTDGVLLEKRGEMDELMGDDEIAVELDGKLYILKVQQVTREH